MKNSSLNKKLVINFLFVSALGMFLAGFLTYRYSYEKVYDLTISNLTNQLKSIEASIQISYNDNIIRQKIFSGKLKQQIYSRLSVDSEQLILKTVENQVTHEKIEIKVPTFLIDEKPISNDNVVDHTYETLGSTATLFVKIPQGLLRVSTTIKKKDGTRAVGTYIPLDSAVTKSIFSGQPYFGRAFVVDDWYITAYEPIFNSKNEVVGAFYVGNKETSLEQIKNYLKSQKILTTGYYFVIDDDGKMVVHPEFEGQDFLEKTDADGKFIFKEIIKNESGLIEYRWKSDGSNATDDKIAVYSSFPLMKWHIAANFKADEVKEGIAALRNVILAITAISLLVMIVFIAWFSAKLSKNLDGISSKISSATDSIKDQSQLVSNVSIKLSESSTKQSSALQETVSTLEEITATVQNNLQTTRQSRELSQEVEAITDQGFSVMKNLNSSVSKVNQLNDHTKEEIQKSYAEIESIIQLIQTIDEKSKIINDIVFQTKLLSFNASVEAARAGEHGKGFSVVAEEIGKLATMTGTSSGDIQETLVSTSQKVKEIIASSERRVIQAFELSSKEIKMCTAISDEGIKALEDIKANVSKSSLSITNLTVASEEQSNAIKNIALAIQQIDQVTYVTAELSKESQSYSQQLQDQSQDLEGAMKNLQDLVHGKK